MLLVIDRILDEAHARQLPALIDEWSRTADDRRWIARALRIDLALLTERPELAIPCLYRRCAIADETGFYVNRAPAPDLASLRATVAGFTSRVTSPWLRALRPPPIPIDGAVIEEYRTSARGTLWISDDGEQIGVADVAWERSTGRRVSVTRPAAVAAPRVWQTSRANHWGRLVLEGPHGALVDIELRGDQIVRGVIAIDDDRVIVVGDEMDYDDFFWLVDVRRSRIVWQQPGRIESHQLVDAGHIMIGCGDAISTIALASGETVASWRCPFVDNLVMLPDGNIATRAGSVIRVWNVGEANERPQVQHASTNTWTPAAFSPDGTRLVTGQMLCDAATGAFIAYLDCNGPSGWLEGGPPRNCQRLANGVFAEITPFGLTVWDTRDGKKLHHDRERRARTADCAAFDPTGTYHAVWSDRGALQIFRLREGTLLAEHTQPIPQAWSERRFGFSPDGALLAWETADGARWAVSMAAPDAPRRLADADTPWEPPPVTIEPVDGLLVAGGATIPYDDTAAIASPDGRQFAWLRSHYQLE